MSRRSPRPALPSPTTQRVIAAYDAGLLRPPYHPRVLCVEPTNACNLRCLRCPPRTRAATFLQPEDLACWVAREPAVFGHARIWLHHAGEPLLHPAIDILAAILKERGASLGLSTNCQLLDEESATRLLRCGLDTIVFSLDAAWPATYARLRGGSSLAAAEAGVRRVIGARRLSPSTHLQVQLVYSDQSPAEVLDFLHRWAEAGADSLHVKRCLSRAGRVAVPGTVDERSGSEPCADPWMHVIVSADGSVVPCCADFAGELSLGNLRERTLVELWHSDESVRLRAGLMGLGPLPGPCSRCHDRSGRHEIAVATRTVHGLPASQTCCAELLADRARHLIIVPSDAERGPT